MSDTRKNFTLLEDSKVFFSGPRDKNGTKVKNTEHWWYDITAQRNPCDCFRKTTRLMLCTVTVAGYFTKRNTQLNCMVKLQNFIIKRSGIYIYIY